MFSCNFGLQPLFGKADAEGNPMHKKTKYRLLFSKSNRKRFRTSERIRKWLSFVWQCQARPTLCHAGEEFPTPGENAARQKGTAQKHKESLKRNFPTPGLWGKQRKRPNLSKLVRTPPNAFGCIRTSRLLYLGAHVKRVLFDALALPSLPP